MEPQIMNVSPSMLAGVVSPDGTKHVSPEAQDVLDRLKAHYQALGKPSAAQNYNRHLKGFLAWAEKNGYGIRSLPSTAVEDFLGALAQAGQKESTLYVMRTQLKSALRECHNILGLDVGHLEYQTGKPREVRQHQKAREKEKRYQERAIRTLAQAQAIQAATQTAGIGGMSVPLPSSGRYDPLNPTAYVPMSYTMQQTTAPLAATPEEYPVQTDSAPVSTGSPTAGVAPAGQQPNIIVNIPAQPQQQRPTSTIGARPTAPAAAATPRGVVLNNHTFTGPYIKISRMADGTDPLTPPGSETYVTTLPLTQLAPHGDVAGFLQAFIIPNIRLSPLVSQVHFVFHELNERKQPTGRRDEMIISLPMTLGVGNQQQSQQHSNGFQQQSFSGYGGMQISDRQDSATDFLLKKLDAEAEAAKKRADDLQIQLRTEKDAQTTFLLMQQFQKEQDLRKELEERKHRELDRMREPQMPMMPFYPPPREEPRIEVMPREDAGAAMAKAFADSQAKMMEVMANAFRPQPAIPQKDATEWLVPFLGQMNQQSMQMQQANQQMLVGIMQSNQGFMQALLTRENPTEKMLLSQIAEVKAAASAPKEDEMENFAEKLQKAKILTEMLGGGGGGGGGLIGELFNNAEQIGNGIAAIMAATKGIAPTPSQTADGVPQIAATPQQKALPAGPQNQPKLPPPPPGASENLDTLVMAVQGGNDEVAVNAFVDILKAFDAGEEPFPTLGRRLLSGFAEAEDEGEVYTVVKGLFTVTSRQFDRVNGKAIANVLSRWYAVIHSTIFGAPKQLVDGSSVVQPQPVVEGEDEEGAEDESADESEEQEEVTA